MHDVGEIPGFCKAERLMKMLVWEHWYILQCSVNTNPSGTLPGGRSRLVLIFAKPLFSFRSRKADVLFPGCSECDFHLVDHQQESGELKDMPKMRSIRGKPCQAAPQSFACKGVCGVKIKTLLLVCKNIFLHMHSETR